MESTVDNKSLVGRHHAKGKYDIRFVKQVVAEVEAGLPRQAAIREYGVKEATLDYWLHRYASRHYLEQHKRHSPATKRSAARAVLDGRMTVAEVMTTYRLKDTSTIQKWILWEKHENDDLAASNISDLSKNKSVKPSPAAPNAEVKALQQQLADAQLRIAALNTLIDVAEEQLKINIRKKPGARQS